MKPCESSTYGLDGGGYGMCVGCDVWGRGGSFCWMVLSLFFVCVTPCVDTEECVGGFEATELTDGAGLVARPECCSASSSSLW